MDKSIVKNHLTANKNKLNKYRVFTMKFGQIATFVCAIFTIAYFPGQAIAACVTSGNTVTCDGDRDASHDISLAGGVNQIRVDPGSTLTDSTRSGALVNVVGRPGPLDVVIGSGTTAVGSDFGNAVTCAGLFCMRVSATEADRSFGEINVLVEENVNVTTGPGGLSSGIYIHPDFHTGDINAVFRGNMKTTTYFTDFIAQSRHNTGVFLFGGWTHGNLTATLENATYESGAAGMPATNAHGINIVHFVGIGDANANIINSKVKTMGAFSHGAYITMRNGTIGDANINIIGSELDIISTSAFANLSSHAAFINNGLTGSGGRGDSNVLVRDSSINVSSLSPQANRAIVIAHDAIGDVNVGIENSSVTVANNEGADGAVVYVRDFTDTEASDVFVFSRNSQLELNSGAGGDGSAAILLEHSGLGRVLYGQDGAAQTTVVNGDNVDGISIRHTGLDSEVIAVDVASLVSATGLNSRAIHLFAQNNTPYSVLIRENAQIIGGSGDGRAIAVNSPGGGFIEIEQNATVDGSASGIAIRDGDQDATPLDGVDETGGDLILRNAGNIIGSIIAGQGDDIVELNGGSIQGDIYADDEVESATDGDDTFVFSGGRLEGTFYGQGGNDLVLITGSPNYTGTEIFYGGAGNDDFVFKDIDINAVGENIREFESVTVDGGRVSFVEDSFTINDFIITNGGVFDAKNNFALNAELLISNAGVFEGAGGGTGVYAINGNVINNGFISTADGATGDIVNINGNYSGAGTFSADVDTDNNTADTLQISGDSAGAASLVRVNNVAVSGVGQDTGKGVGNGIPVVLVGGAAENGDFALEGEELLVGAYSYKLNKEADNVFYLQSELMPQVVAMQSMPSVMRSSVTTVPSSPIRQSTSLTSLRQRIGNCQIDEDGKEVVSDNCHDSYSWARVAASELDMAPPGNQQAFSEKQKYLHFGHDVELTNNPDAAATKWFAGINMNVGDSDLVVEGNEVAQVASVKKDFVGVGASLTRYGNNGVYTDFILQYTDHDNEISSAKNEDKVNGHNIALSAEVGKRYESPKYENWSFTPQIQLIASRTEFNDFVDDVGVEYSNDDGNTLSSRIGLLVERRERLTEAEKARGLDPSSAYMIVNLHNNIDGETAVVASGTRLTYEDHDAWVGLGFGGNLNLTDDVSLFGEINYSMASSDPGDSDLLAGTLGIRKQWKSKAR